MEVKNVRRRIRELRLAQSRGRPIGRLLLLGQFNAQELAGQVLKAMAIGLGPDQFGRDFGAIDAVYRRSKRVFKHRNIKTTEVKNLCHALICKELLEIGRAGLALGDLHNIRCSIAR